MTYDVLITALENLRRSHDNTHFETKEGRHDQPNDLSETKGDEDQRITDFAVLAVCKGSGRKCSWEHRARSELELKHEGGSVWQRWQGSASWRTGRKKRREGQKKEGHMTADCVGIVGQREASQRCVRRTGARVCMPCGLTVARASWRNCMNMMMNCTQRTY